MQNNVVICRNVPIKCNLRTKKCNYHEIDAIRDWKLYENYGKMTMSENFEVKELKENL